MIAVVGCGNTNRRDDGVGPEIVRILRQRATHEHRSVLPYSGLQLIDAGIDGMAAMFAARGCLSLIVVDACRSGSPPGSVFELPGSEVERNNAPALTLHDFRWEHALYAGRQIFRDHFPTDVIVLLIEAESVAFGIGLSAAVSTAAELVVERIVALVESRSPRSQATA